MNHEDFLKQMIEWERGLEPRLENQPSTDKAPEPTGKDIIGCVEVETFLKEMARAESHH